MHEMLTQSPALWETPDGIRAAALRAEAWAGEPFLEPDDDPLEVVRPGSAMRKALEDALVEIDAGLTGPSPAWKTRYALMLGLERVLSEKPPRLASGTELRRHQIDALAGMLTELIAAIEKSSADMNGSGNGNGAVADEVIESEYEEEDETSLEFSAEFEDDGHDDLPPPPAHDPGAERRYRFRHPTASGKTIAAAGFVEAARTEGVLILTHRRLLVTQFTRELTDHGYGDRLTDVILEGSRHHRSNAITIQTYAWFARHVGEVSRGLPARHLRRGAHRLR
jgi:hypothetical protein